MEYLIIDGKTKSWQYLGMRSYNKVIRKIAIENLLNHFSYQAWEIKIKIKKNSYLNDIDEISRRFKLILNVER